MIRVLVVDDSSFFRGRIKHGLIADGEINVIGEAVNGQDAIEKVAALKPDVVTMDIEMPVMDGITAVRKIMSVSPLPIIMFSSLTREGAGATLEALNAGAADFINKDYGECSIDKNQTIAALCEKIRVLGRRNCPMNTSDRLPPGRHAAVAHVNSERSPAKNYGLAIIAASTGGPAALETVLRKLPACFPVPVVLVQHMPATFTHAFAERLDKICKVDVREATEGDELRSGTVYIAPGGKQTYIRGKEKAAFLHIGDAPAQIYYKPCADITFNSVANRFHGKILAIVMTGMGTDGCAGTRQLKQKGATVWAQDEASCVVFGMPLAVIKAQLADNVLSLEEIGRKLAGLH